MTNEFEEYTSWLITLRPDCIGVLDQTQQWAATRDIPALITFFAQDKSGISKLIHSENFLKRYQSQEELFALAYEAYQEPVKIDYLQAYSINLDGSLNGNDPLLSLLYFMLPYELQPRMQTELLKRYEAEDDDWQKRK